jgi:hypothetical protein
MGVSKRTLDYGYIGGGLAATVTWSFMIQAFLPPVGDDRTQLDG